MIRRGIIVQRGDNQGVVVKFDLREDETLPEVGDEITVPYYAEISPYVFSEFRAEAAEMRNKTFCVKQVQLIREGELDIVHKIYVDSK